MTIDRLSAWWAVGRALAAKLQVPIADLTILDFWPSAVGLRVAYRWQDPRLPDDMQESVPMDAEEVDRIMEIVR